MPLREPLCKMPSPNCSRVSTPEHTGKTNREWPPDTQSHGKAGCMLCLRSTPDSDARWKSFSTDTDIPNAPCDADWYWGQDRFHGFPFPASAFEFSFDSPHVPGDSKTQPSFGSRKTASLCIARRSDSSESHPLDSEPLAGNKSSIGKAPKLRIAISNSTPCFLKSNAIVPPCLKTELFFKPVILYLHLSNFPVKLFDQDLLFLPIGYGSFLKKT